MHGKVIQILRTTSKTKVIWLPSDSLTSPPSTTLQKYNKLNVKEIDTQIKLTIYCLHISVNGNC